MFYKTFGKFYNLFLSIIRYGMKSAVEIEYNPDRALTKAIEKAQQLDTYVVVAGSFYLVSEFATR